MRLAPILISFIAATWLVFSGQSLAAEADSNRKVTEAKQLLDRYYGSRENLQLAATLLEAAIATDDSNANAYVQAARLTIMGGHIFRDQFQPNSVEAYHALLDKALSIDPSNQKAHILKAEAHDIQKNYPQEKASLERARELGSTDPWLYVGYGRYYGNMRNGTLAYAFYSKVEALGPGDSAEQRRAYISALLGLSRYKPRGQPSRLKELASRASRERDPADAWILGDFAELFVFYGMFDDAIEYAREALRTMNYGAARLVLAESLYGKAAQLIAQDKSADANDLIVEARHLGFDSADVLARLETSNEEVKSLMPILSKIVK
jgi:tetratricopeptide (TPR) repeat protein